MGQGRTGVEAVERGLAILSAFHEGAEELTLAELARRTGFYKSTILRLAASLQAGHYLARRPDGTFHLGPELWRLGSLYRRSFDLGEFVRPVLRDLVAATGETASFYVRDGAERVCLYRVNSPRAVRHHLDEGVRLPLDKGAAGRVLLACGGPGTVSPPTGTLLVSRGERDAEVAAIAVPVFDASGRLRGALSVSTLLARFDSSAERVAGGALGEGAKQLLATLPVGDDHP